MPLLLASVAHQGWPRAVLRGMLGAQSGDDAADVGATVMRFRLWLARARYAARRLDPLDVLAAGLAGFLAWLLIEGVKAAR